MRPEPPDAVRSRGPHASSAYLHTKAIVIDREHAIVGSMNLDPRSRLLNTEVALFVQSPELGSQLGALFEQAVGPALAFRVRLARTGQDQTEIVWITEENGKEVRYDREPAGFWRRFLSQLLGIFAPEELL